MTDARTNASADASEGPVADGRRWTLHRANVFATMFDGPKLALGERVEVVPIARLAAMEEERNRWIRLFTRLDAAVSTHRGMKSASLVPADEHNEALDAAHDRILRDAAS